MESMTMSEMGSRADFRIEWDVAVDIESAAEELMTLGTIYAKACSRPSTSVTCIVWTLSRYRLVSLTKAEGSSASRLCAICSSLVNDILRSEVRRIAPPGSAEHDGSCAVKANCKPKCDLPEALWYSEGRLRELCWANHQENQVPFACDFRQKTALDTASKQTINLMIPRSYPTLRRFGFHSFIVVFRKRHKIRSKLAFH